MSNTLYVIAEYRCRNVRYPVGKVLDDLSDQEYKFLMNDAPGCFSEEKPKEEKKAKKAPPKDKSVKGA